MVFSISTPVPEIEDDPLERPVLAGHSARSRRRGFDGSGSTSEEFGMEVADPNDFDLGSQESTPPQPVNWAYMRKWIPQEKWWKESAHEFETDFGRTGTRMHRFPPSMQGLGRRYILPMALAIGPYHSPDNPRRDSVYTSRYIRSFNIDGMEKMKGVAAHHFIADSGHSYEEMHAAVLSVAAAARSAYESREVMVFSDAHFADMMLRDGCFLLQYMLMWTARHKLPPSLVCFFNSNHTCITNDIMLLENQLPWAVLQTLRGFRPVDVEEFVAKLGRTLQVRGDRERKEFDLKGGIFTPPHLLGLLRFYKVGASNTNNGVAQQPVSDGSRLMSKTTSAIELAEIGIKLTPSKTTMLVDMGIKKTLFSGQIFLPPLLLDEIRSRWLVNLAAFEVCMTTDTENPVVCSYLSMMAMLMDREEDVHELRSNRLVQGQLTNKETLDFFKSLVKHISGGPQKIHMMQDIETYKLKRWIWIKLHRFVYRYLKVIVTVLSVIGVLAGIFKTLMSLKQR
ncbi:hypothetical protein QYE76_003613 [Lolium multiflorum]|uniref:Uncharacterized protein n=1 Tax=Lolium multiflorum TaxID=4521 RepID=A0AAD8W1F4_LOLMU|nr:hypothetical protein QYE76_003613 [Lolium multiflorum]